MSCIELRHIYKYYQDQAAISDLSLQIETNDFIVVLGPSGCGKTTLLRIIAGLESIDDGQRFINGKDMKDVPANQRSITMVFQNYPLFNHMSVYDNILFGVKEKDSLIHEQIHALASKLSIEHLLLKYPLQLSGGEKQRVAIARSLISKPSIVLMDEPLSSLDPSLKSQLKDLIKELHKELNTTFIYVTHDQNEAMSLATQIVVLKDGKIQQIATPNDLYLKPKNMFVASFIGQNPMNFIPCHVDENQIIHLTSDYSIHTNYQNQTVILGIRPEHIHISNNGLLCSITKFETVGYESYIYTTINNTNVKIKVDEPIHSDSVYVTFDLDKIRYY